MKKFLIGFLALFILTACSGRTSASVAEMWSLVSFGPPSVQIPAVADVETSIEFKDGRVSGNVGCNGFGGEYEVDGDMLTFDQMMSTLMFCDGPIGEQEAWTMAVLHDSASFVLDGDILTITAGDGDSAIVLVRQ